MAIHELLDMYDERVAAREKTAREVPDWREADSKWARIMGEVRTVASILGGIVVFVAALTGLAVYGGLFLLLVLMFFGGFEETKHGD